MYHSPNSTMAGMPDGDQIVVYALTYNQVHKRLNKKIYERYNG